MPVTPSQPSNIIQYLQLCRYGLHIHIIDLNGLLHCVNTLPATPGALHYFYELLAHFGLVFNQVCFAFDSINFFVVIEFLVFYERVNIPHLIIKFHFYTSLVVIGPQYHTTIHTIGTLAHFLEALRTHFRQVIFGLAFVGLPW